MSQCGHFSDKGRGKSIFCFFCGCSLWTAPYPYIGYFGLKLYTLVHFGVNKSLSLKGHHKIVISWAGRPHSSDDATV